MNISRMFKMFFLCTSFLIITYYVSLVIYPGSFINLKFLTQNISGSPNFKSRKKIEIWGKASIAEYLWKHILQGETTEFQNGFFHFGILETDGLELIFRSGPGYIQTTVPQNVSHLVLVINGHTEEKVIAAKQWLDYLPRLLNLQKVAVILLGSEECENGWILPYMTSHGGLVNLLFLVYDSPLIDNVEIYQWPLGVATYRGFPNIKPLSVKLENVRPYRCNFVGTVYKNSSRQVLEEILKRERKHKCQMSTRKEWASKETRESLKNYMEALFNSDFTLNPVGKNAECYRIYEAMSLGSIPIVEDLRTSGKCTSPFRLLKQYKAPIFYIKDWNYLDSIFVFKNFTVKGIVQKRKHVFYWYHNFFKIQLRKVFLQLINEKFFISV